MNRSKSLRRIVLVALLACCASGVFIASRAAGQDDLWQIRRADYGWRDQRTDVTGLVMDLLSRGGVNGRIAVANQTMGGDPAVGQDKMLRIFAINRRGVEREFDFKEGGAVDVSMFEIPRNDWGCGPGQNDRPDVQGLQIIRAFYGVQGHTVNVTPMLRERSRSGAMSFRVENAAFGGDPAVGADKVLVVIYRYQGQEQAAAIREGNTVTIP